MKSLTNGTQMPNAGEAISFSLLVQQTRTQEEIVQDWGGSREPVVSICCATFNHVNYIEDAIRSFLAQETTFAFEIIIHDDASTDGTIEIVQDYARRYPDIIRPVIESENSFNMGYHPLHVWPPLVRGKYFAACEGDDFWISPVKLQRQFELLEKYPQAVMSVARSHDCRQDGDELCYLKTTNKKNGVLLDFEDVHNTYFHTSTYLIRANILMEVIEKYYSRYTLFGDTALRAILIMHGSFAFLSEVVSVYRITGAGIWSELNDEQRLKWELKSARGLARELPGIYGKHQRHRVYLLAMRLFLFYVKKTQIIEAIKIAPTVFWYRLIKVPNYIRRKLKGVLPT